MKGTKMKSTVSLTDFRDAFGNYDRLDNFSYEGLELLYDMFEELDPDMELDVIAICCDFNEDTWQNIANNYSIVFDNDALVDERENLVIDYLQDHTLFVGKTDTGLVYQAF